VEVTSKEYGGWKRNGRYVASGCQHIFFLITGRQLCWKLWSQYIDPLSFFLSLLHWLHASLLEISQFESILLVCWCSFAW
jgi:hypothetical protein